MGLRLATAKKFSQRPISCLFHLPLQAFVATILKLKAKAGTIFGNCEKSNDGNPQKSDKVPFKTKNVFNSTMMASFLQVIVSKKERTNREKYVFYCSVSQIHINPKKKTPKKHQNDFL